MYVMAFDYGSKRIGVAIGQKLTATATPLTIIPQKKYPDWARINDLIQEWQPEALVVGLPKHADGSDNIITKAVFNFSQQLQERYQLPVYTIDEHLSSIAAAEQKAEQGYIRKKNVGLDAIAAKIILETWFTECL